MRHGRDPGIPPRQPERPGPGQSSEWYCETLGFDVDAEIEGDGFRRTRLRTPGSGLTLTLTAHEQQPGEPFDERRTGVDTSSSVGSTEAVQELKGRFEQLGVVHSEAKGAAGGSAMITLRDPDNIQLEVFGGSVDDAIATGRA